MAFLLRRIDVRRNHLLSKDNLSSSLLLQYLAARRRLSRLQLSIIPLSPPREHAIAREQQIHDFKIPVGSLDVEKIDRDQHCEIQQCE